MDHMSSSDLLCFLSLSLPLARGVTTLIAKGLDVDGIWVPPLDNLERRGSTLVVSVEHVCTVQVRKTQPGEIPGTGLAALFLCLGRGPVNTSNAAVVEPWSPSTFGICPMKWA